MRPARFVDAQHMETKKVTISLELDVLEDTLSGRARNCSGGERDFLGWLGLVAAIDALLPSSGDSSQEVRP